MNGSPGLTNLRLLMVEQGLHLWRRRWLALAACWAVCILGWTAVNFLPRQYTSNARVYIDVNGLLAPLLRGLVVDTNANQADYLRQTLLSRPNLDQVVRLAELDAGASAAQREAIITRLASSIRVANQGRNLLSISYTDQDPAVAKSVVESLLTIFSEQAAGSSRVAMEGARKFLDQQIAHYEGQLRAAERRRADFRKEYAEYFADTAGMPRLYALQQRLAEARREYEAALTARGALQAQLQQVPAFLAVDSAPSVSASGQLVGSPSAVRLAQAQRALAQLRLRYADMHPDVLAARREIEILQSELQAPQAGDVRSPEGGARIPNPTYEQIRLKLVDAETAIAAAQQRVGQASADFERVRAVSAEIPDIDAKASDLDRDYQVIKRNHDALLARRESATLSQAADDQADRTQFRVVDPPLLPTSPTAPNLPLMLSFVLVSGLAVGGALPIAVEHLRGTFTSVRQLRELGLPVIGCFTYAVGKRRVGILQVAAVALPSAALFVAYFALLWLSTGPRGGVL